MDYWKKYGYIDIHHEFPERGIWSRWERVRAEDVVKRFGGISDRAHCFATVQRFKDATSPLERQRSPKEVIRPRKPNGRDYEEEGRLKRLKEADELPDQQSHYHGLYFDFDADPHKLGLSASEALGLSQGDTARLADFFLTTFDLNPAHVQVWFSGRKGFHLLVRPEPFGIHPHHHLTYIVRNVALELAEMLELKTMDSSVYSLPRMWRVANTKHLTSGLFKIELSSDELKSFSASDILTLAKEPRWRTANDKLGTLSDVWEDVEYKDIVTDKLAELWFRDRFEHYDAYRDLRNLRPKRKILTIGESKTDEYPACVKDLLDNGPKDGGPNRNRVILPLAGFMYDAGLDEEHTQEAIASWTKAYYPDPGQLRVRLANGRSVVSSAYRGQVRFSCRFIRSCNGPGEKGRVACVGEEKCAWIQDPKDQEPAVTPMIHLSDASKGCYHGTKIRTAVHVATMAGRPYQLPYSGKIRCRPDMEAAICQRCPNNANGGNGNMEWKFSSEDRLTLNLFNVNDNMKKAAVKEQCRIPAKCYKCRVQFTDYGNIEEIQVIPMVDYANAYQVNPGEDENDKRKAERHVVSVAYHMGHGIESNKKYLIEPTVFGHPRDQRTCFLFDKFDAAQNDIDQFRMTPELKEKLKVFQLDEGQSVESKFMDIHRDFTANVHHIGGRMELSIGVDLCYHSVIGFKLAGDTVKKGWFELLVIGDTSTGKTTMIEQMMSHFGLGELIAGEDSKRTGLIYASVQMQGQWVLLWGKIPQNDRRLLVIDEFAGIPGEEVKKMTQLRSEGKARGGGVNAHYETFARTRLILLTNPRGNRGSLLGYNYGVQAVDKLFDDRADMRRVDLAIIARKDEVPSRMITKRWDQVDFPHRYTADLCRNLVLWAWSRDPHHVKWSKGAEAEVFYWADRLGDVYECDLPLAERADLRHKIARISAAVAARLFSTDEKAKEVHIGREHVAFAAKLMDRVYRKASMSYFEYARKYKQDNHFTEKKRAHLVKTITSFGEERHNIVSALLDVDLLTKPVFTDMVNLEADELKRLWKFMIAERLLRKVARGYCKTGAFTEFLKEMGGKNTGYEGGLSDSFETGGEFGSRLGGSLFQEEDEPLDNEFYGEPERQGERGERGFDEPTF